MLVNVVYALLLTGSWEGIRGMGAWVKKSLGATPPWIMAAEAHAKSRWGTMIQWLEGCPSHSLPFHLLPLPPHPLPLSPFLSLSFPSSPYSFPFLCLIGPLSLPPLSSSPLLPPSLIVTRQHVKSTSRHWTSSTPQKTLSWDRLRKLPMPQLSTSLSTGYVHA